MKIIKKSAEIVVSVFNLLMGEDIEKPVERKMKEHPSWHLY